MTFRELTGKKYDIIDFDREVSVYEVLNYVSSIYGESFKRMLFDRGGNLEEDVKILLDSRDIRGLEGIETKVRKDSVISIFPPIGGGSPLSARKLRVKPLPVIE